MARKKKESTVSGNLADNMNSINSTYGDGTIIRFGEKVHADVTAISTGSIDLDAKLGVGGLPLGRIVDCYGPPSGGKSTLSLHLIANAQKAGYRCAYIDTEFSFDPKWATTIGVNVDELIFSQPDCAEEGLDIIDKLVKSKEINVIIVDSASAMVPRDEQESDFGKAPMAIQGRLFSQAMRKLCGPVAQNNVLLLFINQMRANLNTMGYGPSETATGGAAIKFYASIRLDVRRIGSVKNGEEVIGARTKVKIVKNKLGAPYQEAEFDLRYDMGFDTVGEVIDIATDRGIIQKSGSWYSMGEEKLGQGRESVRDYFDLNPEAYKKVYADVISEEEEEEQESSSDT